MGYLVVVGVESEGMGVVCWQIAAMVGSVQAIFIFRIARLLLSLMADCAELAGGCADRLLLRLLLSFAGDYTSI